MATTATTSPRDQVRWIKFAQKGMRLEEIALQEAATVEAVKESVERYESVRMLLTMQELEADQVAILRANNELRKQALAAALGAVKREIVNDDKGYPRVVELGPDHDVQLRAVETEISMMAALMPKGGTKVNVAVQNNNGGFRGASAVTVEESFEARLRSVMEKRKALNPAPVETDAPDVFVDGRTEDAEFEDVDEGDEEGEEE